MIKTDVPLDARTRRRIETDLIRAGLATAEAAGGYVTLRDTRRGQKHPRPRFVDIFADRLAFRPSREGRIAGEFVERRGDLVAGLVAYARAAAAQPPEVRAMTVRLVTAAIEARGGTIVEMSGRAPIFEVATPSGRQLQAKVRSHGLVSDVWQEDEANMLAPNAPYDDGDVTAWLFADFFLDAADIRVVPDEWIRRACWREPKPRPRQKPGAARSRHMNITHAKVAEWVGRWDVIGLSTPPITEVASNWPAPALPAPALVPAPPRQSAPVEEVYTEQYRIREREGTTAFRREGSLVKRYRDWAAGHNRTICAHLYGELRCDAFDETQGVLIEAKSQTTRESARMAVGQLLDYRRFEPELPRLAVLLPSTPDKGIVTYLADNGVGIIWPDGNGFVERLGEGGSQQAWGTRPDA